MNENLNTDKIYLYAEKKANKFNMYCLLIMCILAALAIICNEVGIFTQSKTTMRFSMGQLILIDLIPFVIYIINDKIKKNPKTIFEYPFFKIILVVLVYNTIIDVCIVLSFQAIFLLVIPLLFVAQYRNNKTLFIILFVLTLLSVPLVTYGSFFFGIYDANLLKPLTQEEAEDFLKRIDVATAKRMGELFLHYCLPRMLCVAAVGYIAVSITKRTSEMLHLQVDLNNKVNEEIINKSNMQKNVIEDLADIIESRDIETGEHIKRTKKYVTILIEAMRKEDKYKDILTDDYCDKIINAAPLHDIGKIVVSDLILCKPGKLTDEEFDKMKVHTTKGGEIIKNILNDLGDEDFLNVAYEVATFHHEKWNGKGYPQNLSEENIPLPARIMAIADVFDALVAERVYKKPMPVDKAIGIIIEDAGTHFDPNIVEVFKKITDKFEIASKEKI